MAGKADPIAALAGSRWRLLRVVGCARKSLLEAGTATALPLWLLGFKLSSMNGAISSYFATIILSFLEQTPERDMLLRIFFLSHILWMIISMSLSFLSLSKLCSPSRDYHHSTLLTKRGSLVDIEHKCAFESEDSEFKKGQVNPWVSMVKKQRPALMSFEERTFVYSARLIFKALMLLVSLATGIVQAQFPESRRTAANAAVIATICLTAFLVGDSLLSLIFGLHMTPVYKLGSWVLSRSKDKRQSSCFCPVDPRSTALQNAMFVFMLQPASLALLVQNYIYDTDRGSSVYWVLPASGALMTFEVVISGAQHLWCPVTYIFGCLVQSGIVVPPHPETPEGLAIYLNYSVQGPVIKLTEGYPYAPKAAWGAGLGPKTSKPDDDSKMASVVPSEAPCADLEDVPS